MNISTIANQVVETKSAVQLRYRSNPENKKLVARDESGNIQYDVKDVFTGKSRGWQIFDLTTAHAFVTVYNALNDENKSKFDRVPLHKLLDLVWSNVH